MPTQKSFSPADPAIVPVEGPALNEKAVASGAQRKTASLTATQANPYGQNNEQLPERLEGALRRLVHQFSFESEGTRRQEVRRIKQAHQFWRGLQYLWWNERDQNWHLPFEQKLTDSSSLDDLPRYEFVTNIYQAFGLSLVSVLSQDVPRVRFFPSSAQAEEDVAAAKSATEVAQLVERNNRIGNLIVEEAFNLWTDGKVGAYVRFVVDGQRFGFHPETEIGAREVKIGSDVYVCPDCGAENKAKRGASKREENAEPEKAGGRDGDNQVQKLQTAVGDASADGGADDATNDTIGRSCDTCGALLNRRGFRGSGTGERAHSGNSPARAQRPGSGDDRRRAGAENSALGQRDARVSVHSMERGSAPGASARGISTRSG